MQLRLYATNTSLYEPIFRYLHSRLISCLSFLLDHRSSHECISIVLIER